MKPSAYTFKNLAIDSVRTSLTFFAAALLLTPLLPGTGPHAFGQSAEDANASVIADQRCIMMGTPVTIKVQTEKAQLKAAHAAIEKAVSSMQALIDTVSSWDADSQTSQINQNAGKRPVPVSDDLMQILQKAQDVSDLSNGAFDITFSAVGQLWKLRPVLPVIPTQEQIDDALGRVGYQDLILDTAAMTAYLKKEGMRIDLGGIAKGSVVDTAVKSLRADGFTNFLINAGGDLRIEAPDGQPGWKVGITNPLDPRGPVLATLERQDGAIVTSGDYEKMVEINGKRYHHIIDPRTGKPADGCISVTVLAPKAQTADALATALFVMGPEKGLALCETLDGVEAFFIDMNHQTWCSSGFPSRDKLNHQTLKKPRTSTDSNTVRQT